MFSRDSNRGLQYPINFADMLRMFTILIDYLAMRANKTLSDLRR